MEYNSKNITEELRIKAQTSNSGMQTVLGFEDTDFQSLAQTFNPFLRHLVIEIMPIFFNFSI